MVAIEYVQGPSCSCGFLLKALQEVQYLNFIIASVELITNLRTVQPWVPERLHNYLAAAASALFLTTAISSATAVTMAGIAVAWQQKQHQHDSSNISMIAIAVG